MRHCHSLLLGPVNGVLFAITSTAGLRAWKAGCATAQNVEDMGFGGVAVKQAVNKGGLIDREAVARQARHSTTDDLRID